MAPLSFCYLLSFTFLLFVLVRHPPLLPLTLCASVKRHFNFLGKTKFFYLFSPFFSLAYFIQLLLLLLAPFWTCHKNCSFILFLQSLTFTPWSLHCSILRCVYACVNVRFMRRIDLVTYIHRETVSVSLCFSTATTDLWIYDHGYDVDWVTLAWLLLLIAKPSWLCTRLFSVVCLPAFIHSQGTAADSAHSYPPLCCSTHTHTQ